MSLRHIYTVYIFVILVRLQLHNYGDVQIGKNYASVILTVANQLHKRTPCVANDAKSPHVTYDACMLIYNL